MTALYWNCRVLENSYIVNVLRNIMQRWDPSIVFLLETKLNKKGMEKARDKAGFVYGLIPKSERSGGIAMLQKKDINLEIKGYVGNYIDVIVINSISGFKWRITSLHGHPETHRRKETQEQLRYLKRKFQLPCICFGDFNEILSANEKLGGVRKPQRQIDEFRDAINYCEFRDLGYPGPDYTWCNKQVGASRVYLRLDRVFANQDWIDHFKEARVHQRQRN